MKFSSLNLNLNRNKIEKEFLFGSGQRAESGDAAHFYSGIAARLAREQLGRPTRHGTALRTQPLLWRGAAAGERGLPSRQTHAHREHLRRTDAATSRARSRSEDDRRLTGAAMVFQWATSAWWSEAVLVDPSRRGKGQEHGVASPRPQDPPEQQLTEEGATVAAPQWRGGASVSGRWLR
jgi:hypothetical protein